MFITRTLIGGSLVAMGLVVATPVHAQIRADKAVYFTFSAPVTVPNATLPAGKYLFRLADSLSNRHIVQIYSADGSKLHAMLMTLPQIRQRASDDPEVRFLESPANEAPPIATWWYPGERTGWEFIYPREQARRLAQTAKANVLTTAQNTAAPDMSSGDLVRVSPAGEQTAVAANAELPAFDESNPTSRGEMATTVPDLSRSSASASQSASNQAGRNRLPATSSLVPLAALAGALAFLAAFALRSRRTA